MLRKEREVDEIDVAVAVVVTARIVVGIPAARVERRREDGEVNQVDDSISTNIRAYYNHAQAGRRAADNNALADNVNADYITATGEHGTADRRAAIISGRRVGINRTRACTQVKIGASNQPEI